MGGYKEEEGVVVSVVYVRRICEARDETRRTDERDEDSIVHAKEEKCQVASLARA